MPEPHHQLQDMLLGQHHSYPSSKVQSLQLRIRPSFQQLNVLLMQRHHRVYRMQILHIMHKMLNGILPKT